MSTKREQNAQRLKEIARQYGPEYILDGEVVEVYTDTYTCDVEMDADGSTIQGARLRALSVPGGNQSVDVLPAVGAAVVVAHLGGEDYLVLSIDQITSYRVTVGDFVLTVDENGFGLSNGGDSLKSIMSDMVTGMLSIYAPKDVAGITALTARIDDLLQ
jgi:hypothetical protein